MGRDTAYCTPLSIKFCFNPRARVGRDLKSIDYLKKSVRVSIHAPAWGATCSCGIPYIATDCFNPRARVGRDTVSTILSEYIVGFNPRARVGRDEHVRMMYDAAGMFQSTRPRGARHK